MVGQKMRSFYVTVHIFKAPKPMYMMSVNKNSVKLTCLLIYFLLSSNNLTNQLQLSKHNSTQKKTSLLGHHVIPTRNATQPNGVENHVSTRPQHLSSTSCDLDPWPPNPQNWALHDLAPLTTCANLHQNWFICFRNIMFKGLVTDKRTDRWMEKPRTSCLRRPVWLVRDTESCKSFTTAIRTQLKNKSLNVK